MPLPETTPPPRPADPSSVFDLVRRHFSPKLALTGSFAGRGAHEESAEGCRVTLSDGRRALDFGSYAVTLLGHRHPAVVAAVRDQLDLMPTSTRGLTNPTSARAAETLSGYFGDVLPKVYFGLNGADAVEVAVKLARLATGRPRVLAVRGGFHGKSAGALSLTHHSAYRVGLFGNAADTAHLDPGDPGAFRRALGAGDAAALVLEPVQGENGAFALPLEVLREWCAEARAHGTLVVSDEIQCGLRRCGDRSPALAAGLPVDALLVGKALGGGVVPLSAVVCSPRMYAPLADDPFLHSATFGGHPLSCAALPAALGAVEGLAGHGEVLSAALDTALEGLRRAHPEVVRTVRGRGLLRGLDLCSPRAAGRVVVELAAAGLLVSPCLSRPTTVRLLPPLVSTVRDVEEAAAILDTALLAAATDLDRAPAATDHENRNRP